MNREHGNGGRLGLLSDVFNDGFDVFQDVLCVVTGELFVWDVEFIPADVDVL